MNTEAESAMGDEVGKVKAETKIIENERKEKKKIKWRRAKRTMILLRAESDLVSEDDDLVSLWAGELSALVKALWEKKGIITDNRDQPWMKNVEMMRSYRWRFTWTNMGAHPARIRTRTRRYIRRYIRRCTHMQSQSRMNDCAIIFQNSWIIIDQMNSACTHTICQM